MKQSLYVMGGRRITVARVGAEYVVLLEDGSVYGARTCASETEATAMAVAICNGGTPTWRPRKRVTMALTFQQSGWRAKAADGYYVVEQCPYGSIDVYFSPHRLTAKIERIHPPESDDEDVDAEWGSVAQAIAACETHLRERKLRMQAEHDYALSEASDAMRLDGDEGHAGAWKKGATQIERKIQALGGRVE